MWVLPLWPLTGDWQAASCVALAPHWQMSPHPALKQALQTTGVHGTVIATRRCAAVAQPVALTGLANMLL
jgi:hypothetical protein